MSDTRGSGPRAPRPAAGPGTDVVHEAYSFACMNCGHGWEQAYEIEHHVDTAGRSYVTYLADGTLVPSPLTHPTCDNCEGHRVRIMPPGRVAGVAAAGPAARRAAQGAAGPSHHWPSLHFPHRRRGGEKAGE
ncbi:hypothetical protein [Streptomyces sp. NBC_01198]|uniref:hypothetical protein n=1 Tax=Streptomyces sp. NBC_01198 TaxID=2903769 RepID=UPI002E16060A|nr:hypothetical protein OG702_22835 [Streptomyces sp. NBC_01198]